MYYLDHEYQLALRHKPCEGILFAEIGDREYLCVIIKKVIYGIKIEESYNYNEGSIRARMLGREKLTRSQSKSVDYLCDPLNNSINEKLSRIRQAFRAVAHDSVANCYIVQGKRGEKRSITLSDEYIELGEWGK